ncbi:MAG TPA: sugar phosphate isomerase/epimerase [Blastocatellia bacterium]|nr:sugar phosphate isomerase/epimerase [Blastocatellia bacterium]
MSLAARCSAILLTLALGISAFGQTASNANKQADPTHPVIGIQLYSVRNEMKTDLEGTLEKVKAMGFTYIETGAQSGKSAAEFKALLDKNRFQVVSFFADYNKLKTDFASVVADAKTMNAKYVIVAWIPHQKEFTLADCELAIKDFNEAGEKLAKEGLRFAYHIHGYEFVPHGKGTLMDKLMAETKPQFVNIQMDVFWVAHPGQDPVAFLKKYGKRIHLMHMKDMQKGVKGDLTGHADVETNVTIGTGSIDYASIVREARKIGVKYLIIEDESSRSMTQVPASMKYLISIK